MLGNFRKKILSWGAKILFALLIISFGLWGIGDYTTGGGGNSEAVAEVGNRQITGQELKLRINKTLARMRQIVGQNFTNEQARSLGIVDQTLNSMIRENLFLEGADEVGLIINDHLMGQEIRDDKQFKNAGGQFDRDTFYQVLNRAGLNEASFSDLYRNELLQKQLLSTIELGLSVPISLTESIYRYRKERRVAKIIRINHASFKKISDPKAGVIAKYHMDNARTFTAPEYRSFTLLRLRPEDVADEIDVPEGQIKEEYEDRITEFSQQEQRSIQQILVSNKWTADEAVSRLNSGENFSEVAKDVGKLENDTTELGHLTRKQIPITQLADAAFLLAPNTHSQPVKSSLGWHILRVDKVTPKSIKSLAEVRELLKRDIQLNLAADALFSLANKLEDELGAGARIEEAARRLNLKSEKIAAVDDRGLDKAGNRVKVIGDNAKILRTAFETMVGQDSPLTEFGEGSFFILHVDETTPPSLQPLESIMDQLIIAWKKEQQAILAEKRTKDLINQLSVGRSFDNISKELKVDLIVTQPFTRNGEGLQRMLPPQLISNIFSAKVGEAVWAAGDNVHFVAFISEKKRAKVNSSAGDVNAIREQLTQGISRSVFKMHVFPGPPIGVEAAGVVLHELPLVADGYIRMVRHHFGGP